MSQIYFLEAVEYTSLEEIKKYKPKQKIKFICSVCGCEATKYRCNIKEPLVCGKCNHKASAMNINWDERNAKSRKTKLERYGDENFTNISKIKEKWKNKSDDELNEIKERTKQTNKARYNGHPASREEQKERTKDSCLRKYGVKAPMLAEDIKKKIEQTNIERYGVSNVFSNEEIKRRIKETNLERYGVGNPRQSSWVDKKIQDTCIERYGVRHPWSNHEIRVKCQQNYHYDGIFFDSGWEVYLYIYLTEHNVDFEYQPNVYFTYGDNKKYFPDFRIKNDYYEIKGEQFFDGDKMINPYDRELDELYEAKHQCMIENNIKILRLNDLEPVFRYVDEKYTQDYVKLFKTDLKFPYPDGNVENMNENDVIRYFHKSIYSANRLGYKSPLESWADKEKIKKVALNRLKYIGKCRPSDILYGFNVTKIAPKVSVFKYATAKHILETYGNVYKTIIDPFSGFSARMIASAKLGKKYYGFDINKTHVLESREIIKHYDFKDCEVNERDIFSEYDVKEYDCLFTCPPYEDKEKWNESDINLSCDEWINECLKRFKCKRYIFVVDDTEIYRDNIVEEIENTSHFGCNKEFIVVIEK